MKLEVVIPAYNEEAIIGDSIREIVRSLEVFPIGYSIVVANNGSTDATAARSREAGADVLEVPGRGKGAALVHAANVSKAELFAFIDADISAHPRELTKLYEVMQRDSADIVIGSRLIASNRVHRAFFRTFTSYVFNVIRHALLGISVTDTQCGLKLMNSRGRVLLAKCVETGWFVDMELLARAERAGLRISEVPVEWEEFRYKDRTSKLRIVRDGIGALYAMKRVHKTLT